MRILVHDYAGHPFQVHLSRQMASRGHDVTHAYFADDPGPKGMLQSRAGDPPTLRFVGISIGRPYDKSSLIARHINDLEYGKRAALVIKDLRPEVVISGNTPTEAQTAIVGASKAVGACIVHWLQDFYSVAATKLLRRRLGAIGGLIGRYYQYLERRQLRAADAVIVITDDFRPLASAWAAGDDKIYTIENWASLDDIPLMDKTNDWSRQHQMTDGFTFLYSGTLGLKNSPGFLVRLAQECDAQTSVTVVGQGVGMKQLEAAKAEHGLGSLKLLPLQPHERFPEVLAAGDVLVALVEADAGSFSVPSKVQSYMCAGRPILLAAPSDNLAARIVAREAAGIVVGPHDETDFIAAARLLRADPVLRARMGANARAYAARTFDIVTIVDRFEEAVHAAIKRAAPQQGANVFSKRQKLGEAETYS